MGAEPGSSTRLLSSSAAQGTTTVEYYSTDYAGNKESIEWQNVGIDTVKPQTTLQVTGAELNNGWWTSATVVSFSATDASSGVSGIFYSLNKGKTWIQYVGPLFINAQGKTPVKFYSVDNAGNVEKAQSYSLQIDMLAPHTTDSLAGTLGNNGWYTSSVTISLSATDANSSVAKTPGVANTLGVANTFYSLDGGKTWILYKAPFVVKAQGTTTLKYYSVDKAGNQESTKSDSFKIDTAAPHTTESLAGTLGSNGWYTSNVTITLSAADPTSGVANTFYSRDGGTTWGLYKAPFVVKAQGTTTVKFFSLDKAGNREKGRSYSFKIDMLAPYTNDSLAGTLGTNGWYTSSVIITLSATDAKSGVASTFYSLDGSTTWIPYKAPFVVKAQGTTTLKYYSVDKAGNQESTKSDSFKIDTAAPHTTDSLAGTLSNNDWYTSSVTITLSATDATSSVAITFYSLDGGTTWILYKAPFVVKTRGTTTLKYFSLDNAGNRGKTTSERL